MAKPIGRLWRRNNSMSGYIVIAPGVCIKFAGSLEKGTNWIFASKKCEETESELFNEEKMYL